MRTVLVTGSDTGIGKTHVVGELARALAAGGARVQIVKPVETGVPAGAEGDAERARRAAGGVRVEAFTLASFPLAIAPAAAAAAAGAALSLDALAAQVRALPACDWRLVEGAGGIASPIDAQSRDWADFGTAIGADAVVVVVPDRLGAINQARLAFARAAGAELRAGIWLNRIEPIDPAVASSNRAGLAAAGVPLWDAAALQALPAEARAAAGSLAERWRAELDSRDAKKLRRRLQMSRRQTGELNLADNDYLDLARDPALAAAAAAAVAEHGTSASASPLVTGWQEPHARLIEGLCAWHGFPCGLLWNSGYAANSAVLGTLAKNGDLILADRLIHHSLIAGILRSGARLQRYPHLDLDRLERQLQPGGSGPVFVVTESVFSMDGDYPDLARLAALKERFGFFWVLDEAHALGWYGPGGAGLARAAGVEGSVDVLVGTLGKTLASGGAYSLFRDEAVRDFLVNLAGEFIYSTAIPPAAAAAASAGLVRIRKLSADQASWQAASRAFRAELRAGGWAAPEGDSPIVPVRLDDEDAALSLAAHLAAGGIRAVAIRPPTVPAGTSRLRLSLKRTFRAEDGRRVLAAMDAWREGRRP
ncbi:MAG TPA: aminotransferase class I/II-fold pyridoxal phosphate-dependent enzyme [Opitutaceae bacterium]|jgi:8-amino-7-oxononanoate synthase|nr:aminotransferase class I/II-fold pyridoxal phosphate-dependent enzyme [Opitutaceae bacterium]